MRDITSPIDNFICLVYKVIFLYQTCTEQKEIQKNVRKEDKFYLQ